ncbi:serine/threonine protein kinase [Streptomyces pluripotens]|uniref:non-specific serine/threonine protein kinase n=1 Tax=Streptomyces pluripotens TaxID=1355015 RepID=A0A221NUR4_9ACTN|nr:MULTISPECIES: serine/threonine-protein kinase [Streptomyces]ARP69479.1 serine/threonine protein kinase [Streptomyces pluripotens]ASN23739.1 serine/threonine protein kinase [Streptomyces pluripotens]KIE27033.1 protein kinase [Streptomyces sp. MUSC 125]MCH0555443.1 serine/threonine protein kinase [Streptomyces sp. MUM 16J]
MSGEPGRERVIADRYRLLSPLGEGGMGTVWRARDEVLHREVAVKEVRAPAGLPGPDVERMYARLEREAWAAARVANRNVVTVYDVAAEGGRPWIVMELVAGRSLADRLEAEGPLSPQQAARIGAEVLSALRAAHAAGVLHRDVKPANVLLADDGRVVLSDFGIATVEGSSALTMTGEVIGSPEFLAPERALGRTPGPESDLWSLGVLLYAAVEGISPFRQDTPLSTLRAVVDEELPPPRHAGPLAPVIGGLLRKDPAERLSAEHAERELRLVAAGGPLRADTMRPAAPYVPTVAAQTAQPSRTPPIPPPGGYPEPRPATPEPPLRPERGRRSAVMLAAGVLAGVLALTGLTYTLLHHRNAGTGRTGGTASSGRASGAHTPTASSGTASATSVPPSARHSTSTGDGPSVSRPAQSVHVGLSSAHSVYSGSCPPPGAQAPTFTATFTVGRLPAQVEYRWVTARGSVSDPGWKTLSFPSGGGRTRQQRLTVTAYSGSGAINDEISVEVRTPVRATSESVPFSVTCTTAETPSYGASAAPSGSPGTSP